MSDQETSRSFHDAEGDLITRQDLSADLSSPDSGMGNTIFSSPEKSEGNDSPDGKDRGEFSGRYSPGFHQKIRLARNNVYGNRLKSNQNTSAKDMHAWNQGGSDASHLSDSECALSKCLDMADEAASGCAVEVNKDISKSSPEPQSEVHSSEFGSESDSVDCLKKFPQNDETEAPLEHSVVVKSDLSEVKLQPQTSSINTSELAKNEESIIIKNSSVDKIKPLNVCDGSVHESKINQGISEVCQISNILSEPEDTLTTRKTSGDVMNVEEVTSKETSHLSSVSDDFKENKDFVLKENSKLTLVSNSLPRNEEIRPTVAVDPNLDRSSVTDSSKPPSRNEIETENKSTEVTLQLNKNSVPQNEGTCSSVLGSLERNFVSVTSVESGAIPTVKEGENSETASSETTKNLLCHERLQVKELLGVNGGDMGIDLEAIQDTDSEAGESCCSEEQDVCEGENGCIHQDGIRYAEQNWDYLIDEEFNVPKKPILNGSAEQLERRSNLKRKATEEPEEATPTKCKRGIQFEGVTVFYFPRSQGFTCVPSQGGSTLGMSRRHAYIRQFSLAEHAVEQRRAHREYLLRLRQQRKARERGDSSSRGSSSEDSEENSEEASDLSDSELDADSYFFLQPLPIRQRRALLRQAGICHIEGLEKEECKGIRVSRELCGCQCKVYCDPDTCECAEAGIRCQVDRHNFPCGCSREGCGNTFGRIEFNPIRVRTHFIHTLMRLEIEKRQHQQHQQQQHWQHQQRAKWLATTSAAANGFSSTSGVASGNLPFFEGGGREAGALAVADLNKFTSTVEMTSCVGSMNTALYSHQMLGPAATYVQQDSVGDFNSTACSVFGGLGTTFDPSSPYGAACHSFPSSSVVPPQVVTPQVAHPPPPPPTTPQVGPPQPSVPPPPEPYNSLSKFANTANLVSTTFPYSGALVPVNCSNTHNNNNNSFCVPGVHDTAAATAAAAAAATVFGHYQEHGPLTQNLFKTNINECSNFQPNFEAISSTSASSDKTIRYMASAGGAATSTTAFIEANKDICNNYAAAETSVNNCPSVAEGGYGIGSIPVASNAQSLMIVDNSQTPDRHSSTMPVTSSHSGDPRSAAGESTEAAENLGEIVKKSIVETVSA